MAYEEATKAYSSVQETGMTPQAMALELAAGGDIYVFLVPELSGNNERLTIHMRTNVPEEHMHIVRTTLEAALATLPTE